MEMEAEKGINIVNGDLVGQTVQAYCMLIILLPTVFILSRVIALPSVKYDVLGRARQVASQPFTKITIDPEPCMTMLLEKLRKSDWSLRDCCLCLQHIFKDEPWLLWVSGETRWGARNTNTQAYRSYLYLYRGHTNSTNLGAVVSLP